MTGLGEWNAIPYDQTCNHENQVKNKSMTLEEIRTKQKALELQIGNLVAAFEKDTSISISTLELVKSNSLSTGNEIRQTLLRVEAKISL